MSGLPLLKRPRLSDSEDDDDDEQPDRKITIVPWRMDPQKSFSDWTIEISSSGGSTATYHVHKRDLAVGDATCDYFECLFRKSDNDGQQKFSEFDDCTSRFKFDHQKAADAFPAFLDFIYLANDKYINTKNAIALYFLAEYFGCRRLRRNIRRFFEGNLSSNNLAMFYTDTKQFQNEKFFNEIVQYCAMNVENVSPENSIVDLSDENFWLAVLSRFKGSPNQSKSLSLLIAAFCAKTYQNLELDLFAQLTNKSKLPKIHYQAAIQLIAVEQTLLSRTTVESTHPSVKTRCETALIGHCAQVDLDKVADSLHWVDSKILFDLLKLFVRLIGTGLRQVAICICDGKYDCCCSVKCNLKK